MSVKEIYFNRYSGWRDGVIPKGEIIFIQRSRGHVLSPSTELLTKWQNHKKHGMTWEDYTKQFLGEMQSPKAQAEIERLARLAIEKGDSEDIWLVCSCSNIRKECHRFIIIELIQKKILELTDRGNPGLEDTKE